MINNSVLNQLAQYLPSDEAKRVFHGRGGLFEGWEQVNIEVYPPVMWVIIYQDIDDSKLKELLAEVSAQAGHWALKHIYIQRRFLAGNPVEVFLGDDSLLEVDFQVTEQGLKYWVNLGKNQNSGLFLDMCEGRKWVRSFSNGKSVLNLFSYTCSLGISAAAGNAQSVVNVDMAKAAIKKGQQNLSINELGASRVSFIAQDIFKMVKKIKQKGPFDLLIADPPSFQSKAFDVRRDYTKLLEKFKGALAADACLMLCLNSPALGEGFLKELVNETLPEARFIKRLDNPKVLADSSEDASLKVLIFKIESSSAADD
jgi:23S rRNA (cytosine1962-C5)-methyltransferase